MNYDVEKTKLARNLAVTKLDDLVVGNIYWTNSYPTDEPLLLVALMDQEEKVRRGNYDVEEDDIKRAKKMGKEWAVFTYRRDREIVFSLHDKNVLASYNPWMIFDQQWKLHIVEEMELY